MALSFRANVVANYGGQIFASALAFALAPLFVRELGLEAWGLVGILAILSAWFNLVDVGLTPAITREIARTAEGDDTFFEDVQKGLLQTVRGALRTIPRWRCTSFCARVPLSKSTARWHAKQQITWRQTDIFGWAPGRHRAPRT